jgi:hypothetical protein
VVDDKNSANQTRIPSAGLAYLFLIRVFSMTTDTLSRPEKTDNPIKRVAILFAGGPAPAANAVISSAAISFIRNGAEVIGIKHGYSALMEYDGETPLVEGQDYILLTESSLDQTRATPGIMIGTARANPGKSIQKPADFQDADSTTVHLQCDAKPRRRCVHFHWRRRHT